ncbi:MFS transporter [Roseibaca sp. Y0-43]|uniref:MFS transporter n=1 Tax=Roseibaca sp. Y0-43 TaxID=2816854 RepID=UPI001D0C8B4D|nr:MFS transporter [Roseibaca sp. Y0-43]
MVFLAHALGALSILSVLTAGPHISADLELSPLQIGGLASVYSAALAVASLPAGLVTDRLGTRTALSFAATTIATGLVLAGTSQGLVQLGAGMMLCGAGYGLINPAAGVAVTLWFSPKWRATLLSLKQTGVPVGAALGSLTALLGKNWGWQAGILCAAAIALVAGCLFLLLLPSGQVLPRQTSFSKARLAEILTTPGLGRANLAAGLTNGLQFALWAHLPELLQTGTTAAAALLGVCLAALHIGTFTGRVIWGALTDKLCNGDAAVALCWLCVIGLAGLALLGVNTRIESPLLAVIACFVLGFTTCAAVGLHVALTARLAPEHLLGGAMGYTMLVTNIGGVIVPFSLGLAMAVGGASAGSLLLAFFLFSALALLRVFRS